MKPNTILEIERRKSVRVFLDKEIEKDVKENILNACIEAPTAGNMCLYSIIDITDSQKKEQLSVLCDNQPFIKDGKIVLVFVADPTRWYKLYNNIIADVNVSPTLADYFLGVSDALIAAQNAVVAAEAYGIGSCYIGDIVENYEEIKKLLSLPKHVVPVCMLVFGYPTVQQTERTKPARFEIKDIVYENSYLDLSKDEVLYILEKRLKKSFSDLNDFELKDKAINMVKRMYNAKQNTPFFEEMIRSLQLMIEEFK